MPQTPSKHSDPDSADRGASPGSALQQRAMASGTALAGSFQALVHGLPSPAPGPQKLAEALGVDKVLTSRLLKALRQSDPLAVLHHAPGPDPLRRAVGGAREAGVEDEVVDAAGRAVEEFDRLIREEAGDRGSLGTILSAWLPEVRAEFELRRKQAAFRAMSELQGASVETDYSAVFIAPSAGDADRLDVVWLIGKQGLRRLRPDVRVRFATRRLEGEGAPRRPLNLEGEEVEGLDRARLDRFCTGTPAPIEARPAGDIVHYLLGKTGFGPHSAVDFVFAEVNRAELAASVPEGSGRKAFFFAEVDCPARRLQFDVFLDHALYGGRAPELHVYDTSGGGTASVNDRARDIDRMDVMETVEGLGRIEAPGRLQSPRVPLYGELCAHVFERMGWEPSTFRGYRCLVDYPIYGSQVCLAFAVEG